MANKIPRVPVREQDPKVRATNFEEVCYGYNVEEATLEASRCLNCKNPRCVAACPVGIRIPDFIAALHEGDYFLDGKLYDAQGNEVPLAGDDSHGAPPRRRSETAEAGSA